MDVVIIVPVDTDARWFPVVIFNDDVGDADERGPGKHTENYSTWRWKSKDGRTLSIQQMDDRHIRNVLAKLGEKPNWRKEWVEPLRAELAKRANLRKLTQLRLMHGPTTKSLLSCTQCMASFDSYNELKAHFTRTGHER